MQQNNTYAFTQLSAILEQLKPCLRIAVVYGGDKSKDNAVLYTAHNTRSWKSYETVARDIAQALSQIGFASVCVFPDDMTLFDNLRKENIHLVWLNTGGVQGYMPTCHAAAMLEMTGMPYIGHNPMNAAILDNKHIFKAMLQKFDLHTAPFVVWSRSPLRQEREDDRQALARTFGDYAGPFIVKPTSGRASLHVHYAEGINELFEAVGEVYQATQNLVVVEKYIPGKEYCVSICGPVVCAGGALNRHDDPFAFSILERKFEPDEYIFTSMDKKPITPERVRVLDGGGPSARLGELARRVYRSFFLETIVRLDVREDERGEFVVLETNPKPDLKKPTAEVSSLTCLGLTEESMSYNDLITSLLADRLDYLFTYRPRSVRHLACLTDLLKEE